MWINKIKQGLAYCKQKLYINLGLCLVVALFCEGIIFNHFYWRYQFNDYQAQEISIPFNEQLKTNGILINNDNNVLQLKDLNIPLFGVRLAVYGANSLVKGHIAFTDDASEVIAVTANSFSIVPNGTEEVSVFTKSHGNVHDIQIRFEKIPGVIVVTKVILNPEPIYTFYVTRSGLIFLVLALIVLVRRYRLYTLTSDNVSKKAIVSIQLIAYFICCGFAFFFFSIISPKHVDPNLLFDFSEKGFVFLGNKDQNYLLDFPKTREELEYYDPYVKTLDALLKGQLHLDVIIDENLAKLDNPYDPGVRNLNQAEGFWDHSYYKGKYYAYYGYGPVFTIYLPIYLVTGKVPAPAVVNLIHTLLCISAFFIACAVLFKYLKLKRNLLIFSLGQISVVFASLVFVNYYFISFYSIAPALAGAYFLLIIACTYGLALVKSKLSFRVLLFMIGLCVSMIALTRPLSLVYVCIVAFPVLYQLFLVKNKQDCIQFKLFESSQYSYTNNKKALICDLACIGIPTLVGATFTMYTNNARFDSAFEFGQIYCTGLENLLFNNFYFSLDILSHTIYYYFLASYNFIKTFPFFELRRDFATDFSNYQYGESYLGLLAIPVFWFLFITHKVFKEKNQLDIVTKRGRLFRITTLLMSIGLPIVFYLQIQAAAYSVRYSFENAVIIAPFVLILLLYFTKYPNISHDKDYFSLSKIFYIFVIVMMIKSCLIGFFTPFSFMFHAFPYVSPQHLIDLSYYFSPLTTYY